MPMSGSVTREIAAVIGIKQRLCEDTGLSGEIACGRLRCAQALRMRRSRPRDELACLSLLGSLSCFPVLRTTPFVSFLDLNRHGSARRLSVVKPSKNCELLKQSLANADDNFFKSESMSILKHEICQTR